MTKTTWVSKFIVVHGNSLQTTLVGMSVQEEFEGPDHIFLQ